jgi:hypothetical protein
LIHGAHCRRSSERRPPNFRPTTTKLSIWIITTLTRTPALRDYYSVSIGAGMR